MRRLFIVTILLLVLLQASARDVLAARAGFLLLGAPVQKVDLGYQFDGSQQVTSSERHAMLEDYSFKTKYAILRPSLWKGSFMTALRFDQKLATNPGVDSSSSHIGFLYDIDGVLFGESTAPAAFSASSDISQVSTPFARTYQLTNTIYDFRWALKNSALPVSFEYLTGTSETSGQLVDSTRERKEMHLRAGHDRKISSTSLEINMAQNTYTPVQGEGNFDNRYEVVFRNDLFWANDGKTRNFGSQLRYSETAGINYAKYLNIEQTARWDLGKSLISGGNYSLATVSGDPGSQVHQNGSAWLQHQLFKSLTTRLSLRARKDDYPTGDDREVGGDVSVAYAKELPRQSSLSMGVSEAYSVSDRNLGADRLQIFNEQHVVTFGARIFLAQPNVVSSSISVRNADPLKRLLPYNPVIDYRIVPNGALTEIVPVANGVIGDGDTLLISYDIQVDPQLKMINETLGANASVTLFGGAYRVYGLHSRTQQERLAGLVTLPSLTAQTMSRLGFERKWQSILLTTEYETFDSTADRHQSVQAMSRYSDVVREGNMTLLLSERYQWYGPVTLGDTTLQRAAENFISVAASYSKGISTTTQLSLTSNYLNVSGASSSDSFTVGASLRWSLGKLSASLDSFFGVRRQEGATDFTESIRVNVTRYFY